MSITMSNVYCSNCGWQMLLAAGPCYRCPSCDEERTLAHMAQRATIVVFHGSKCEACDGSGETEHTIYERHPYGDTYAIEELTQYEECEECNGTGYHIDHTDQECVVCGLTVGWQKDGVHRGWHVHEDCLDEIVPKLEEWEAPNEL
jgi:hypothetical protein